MKLTLKHDGYSESAKIVDLESGEPSDEKAIENPFIDPDLARRLQKSV